jgi:acyl-CoA synthetase (AMP-forming)/AMP-acid ligase II
VHEENKVVGVAMRRPPGRRDTMRVGANSVTPIEALYQRAWHNPDGTAFVAGGDRWDYARVAAQVKRLARGLTRHGVRKGDRVALQLPDGPEFVTAIYACFHVGAIAVPLTNTVDAIALKRLMTRVRPALYIGDASVADRWETIDHAILPLEMRFVVGGTAGRNGAGRCMKPWESLLCDGPDQIPVASDIHSEAVLFAKPDQIGAPNYVIHSHATLSALFALPFMAGCG